MPRTIKNKELVNTRLATNYGGWMYCEKCGENIGYLCYSTYDKIDLKYQCCCGNHGSIMIDFNDSQPGKPCTDELTIIKNRFCCPTTQDPLITLLDKKLTSYELNITCKSCANTYHRVK